MRSANTLVFSVVLSIVGATLVGVTAATPSMAADPAQRAKAQLVTDIRPGSTDSTVLTGTPVSRPHQLEAFKGYAYFTANNGVNGLELWRTNGTESELVKDINPGSGHGGDPDGPVILGAGTDYLYFRANDGSTGEELWATDGDSTWLVRDINGGARGSGPAGSYKDFVIVGNDAYFSATQTFPDARLTNPGPNDVVHEVELWRANGSSAQRYDVLPINIGGDPERGNPDSSSPGNFGSFGGNAYFSASIDKMSESGGTRLASMFKATPGGFSKISDVPGRNLKELDGRLFYVGTDHSYGSGIYSTAGGTPTKHYSLSSYEAEQVGEFHAFKSFLYFRFQGQLWRTDGSTTQQFGAGQLGSASNPSDFTVMGGHLYFTADDGTHGRELWRTNGSAVELVDDIRTGSGNAFLFDSDHMLHGKDKKDAWLTELNGFLYFAAITDDHGRELWRTNGVATELVADIRFPNTGSPKGSGPSGLTRIGDQIVFSANDGISGQEIWRVFVPTTGVEGPPGHASCSDDVDNDEDGLVDGADPDCQGETEPEITTLGKVAGVTARAGDGRATVSWTPASGAAPTSYEIKAMPGGRTTTAKGNARSATVTGLKNGTSYRLQVVALGSNNVRSAGTSSNTVTPSGKPGRPSKIKAKYAKKKRTLTVSWRASGANGQRIVSYRVTLARKGARAITRVVKGSTLKAALKRLEKGRYTITVQARNASGYSAASATVNVRVR